MVGKCGGVAGNCKRKLRVVSSLNMRAKKMKKKKRKKRTRILTKDSNTLNAM
jgi:hypothetical protein